jgi:hypothetical protein
MDTNKLNKTGVNNLDRITILLTKKNPQVLIEDVNVKPDDYNTGNWIKVVNKNKVKREKRYARRNKEDNDEYIKRLREKKINDRNNAELWYDAKSWQHNVLSEQLYLEDEGSISDKYNLSDLIELYKNAENNYRKNGIYTKLMRIITQEEWEKIKDQVKEK